MNDLQRCLDKHTERLDTLIAQVEQLTELAKLAISPDSATTPLTAFASLGGVSNPTQNYDTNAADVSGRLQTIIITTNISPAEFFLYLAHKSIGGNGLLLWHGYVAAGIPAPLDLAGIHVPQGAVFRLNTPSTNGGIGLTALVTPTPRTGVELFRSQRP